MRLVRLAQEIRFRYSPLARATCLVARVIFYARKRSNKMISWSCDSENHFAGESFLTHSALQWPRGIPLSRIHS